MIGQGGPAVMSLLAETLALAAIDTALWGLRCKRASLVRAAVGDCSKIMVDANQAFSSAASATPITRLPA